jgi:hypothetical protein
VPILAGLCVVSCRPASLLPSFAGHCTPNQDPRHDVAAASIANWTRSDRTKLLKRLDASRILWVNYTRCTVHPLWDCRTPGSYEFLLYMESVGVFTASDTEFVAENAHACTQATHAVVSAFAEAGEECDGGLAAETVRGGRYCPPRAVWIAPIAPLHSAAATCPGGQVLEGDRCVTPVATACPAGQVQQGDACVAVAKCPEGKVMQGDTCVLLPPSSPYWIPDPKTPGHDRIVKTVEALRGAQGDARADYLLMLAEAYRGCSGWACAAEAPPRPESEPAEVKVLLEFVGLPSVAKHRQAPAAFERLVRLSAKTGPLSMHLEVSNRAIELFPNAPQSAAAYLALARYYCGTGDPQAGARLVSEMRRSIKDVPARMATDLKDDFAQLDLACAKAEKKSEKK